MDFTSEGLPGLIREILGNYSEQIKLRSEPDFYGASSHIAKRLGLKNIPQSYSSWSHGCQAEHTLSKEQVTWNPVWTLNKLVRNAEVASITTSFGVKNVHAVGMPINYVDSIGVNRMEKSVLFMPAHSLSYIKIKQDIQGLVDKALSLRDHNYYVCFSVHQDCVIQGNITNILEKHDIDWFAGASASDPGSLQRVRNVFECFEFVASNTMGSYFFYSQLFGAKFFFVDPYFEYDPVTFRNDPFWKNYPDLCNKLIQSVSRGEIYRRYPEYFGDIENAQCNKKLAQLVCGTEHVRGPQEIARLLGWDCMTQVISPLPYWGSKFLNKLRFHV